MKDNSNIDFNNPKAKRTKRKIDKNLNKIKKNIELAVPIRIICQELQISETTFYKWKNEYEPLRRAIEEGEIKAYKNVRRSLNRLAHKAKNKSEKTFISEKGTSIEKISKDKEPDFRAIRHLEGIYEREYKNRNKKQDRVISESDLRRLDDDELLLLLKTIEQGKDRSDDYDE